MLENLEHLEHSLHSFAVRVLYISLPSIGISGLESVALVDPCARGPVVPWTCGPMDPWTHGSVDPWTRGPVALVTFE